MKERICTHFVCAQTNSDQGNVMVSDSSNFYGSKIGSFLSPPPSVPGEILYNE